MKKWARLGLALAALVLVGGSGDRALAQKNPIDEPIGSDTVVNAWAVAPVGPSVDRNQPSERPFLTYSVAPGQVIQDAVVLYNYSNVALNFRLFAADAFNNADGAFDVFESSRQSKDVGTWIKVDQENISLPPKSQAVVPLTITVPRQAAPGDHAGAVLASSAAIGSGPDGKAVNIDRRTGTRAYFRVAGDLTPDLSITEVRNTYKASMNPFGGRVEVAYRIENQGNVRMGGKQRVSASGLLGFGSKETKYLDLPELLPGQGVTITKSFPGMPATVLGSATVRLDPDDAEGKSMPVESRRVTTLAVPWTIVSLIVIGVLLNFSRRSYQRRSALA
ncbi:MAG: DUF916 domain-containing protein [Acidimicrobiales bacterium]|nr:DUF916 domain-containing protein [Acidimicrobiales bacterium]